MTVVGKWCTVTVVASDGRRHSIDVNAESSYDAAHLYLTHAKNNPESGAPIPTTAAVFEVIANGKNHQVSGTRLKEWITTRRQEWKGPRGVLFSQRPILND